MKAKAHLRLQQRLIWHLGLVRWRWVYLLDGREICTNLIKHNIIYIIRTSGAVCSEYHRKPRWKPRPLGRGGMREWPLAASRCDLTYSAIMDSGAPPQLAAKYDGDQRTPL